MAATFGTFGLRMKMQRLASFHVLSRILCSRPSHPQPQSVHPSSFDRNEKSSFASPVRLILKR